MSEGIKDGKWVPVEPTEEMLVALNELAIEVMQAKHYEVKDCLTKMFKAMLAAAPEPTPSVGMEPIGRVVHDTFYRAVNKLPEGDVYSSEQLAPLQAKLEQAIADHEAYRKMTCLAYKGSELESRDKLEQAERENAELVAALRKIRDSSIKVSNTTHQVTADKAIAKYGKKS